MVHDKSLGDQLGLLQCPLMGARMTAAVITGALFCFSLYFLTPLLKANTKGWPVVEGQIIDRQAQRHRERHHQYDILVTYEYVVDGQRYTSRRHTLAIAPVERVTANSQALALERAGFPIGQKVRVFHNPKDPTEAVLNPKISTGSRLIYLAVIGFSGLVFLGSLFGKVQRIG